MSDTPMPEEGFLRRWARLKAQPEPAPADAPQPQAAAVQPALQPVQQPLAAPAGAAERPAPTLEDVARLTPESDYAAFVAGGVDPAVRRLALKKLFADPNFAVMDGLDIYISDYTKASPLTDAMLASLKHAPNVLDRLFGKNDEPDEAAGHDTPTANPPPDDTLAVHDEVPAPSPATMDAGMHQAAEADAVPAPVPVPVQLADMPQSAPASPQGTR
jgi:hypothetical protein